MNDEDAKVALGNERLISSTLRSNLFAERAELLVATAKLGKVAMIARRLKNEGKDALAREILAALE